MDKQILKLYVDDDQPVDYELGVQTQTDFRIGEKVGEAMAERLTKSDFTLPIHNWTPTLEIDRELYEELMKRARDPGGDAERNALMAIKIRVKE